jgi:ATP-dependent Lhr-like helicase
VGREGQGLDPIGQEERVKDRVRQLLERYGVLFRQLLERELPALRWQNVFRTLRVMELGGEAVGGQFFARIPGIQFASPRAHGMLLNGIWGSPTFWMNACDPASLCGAGIEGLRGRLPARLPSTHLVYHGKELVLVSKRRGKELEFFIGPEDPRVGGCLALFRSLLERSYNPLGRVRVETINGETAGTSAHSGTLLAWGFQMSYRGLVLERAF